VDAGTWPYRARADLAPGTYYLLALGYGGILTAP
jgi:hypothetical protein